MTRSMFVCEKAILEKSVNLASERSLYLTQPCQLISSTQSGATGTSSISRKSVITFRSNMSSDAVGPYSPKKKYHWKEGKESLEESIHNVKPLDLNMAHLKTDDNSSNPSDSDEEEVVEVLEDSAHVDDDASSYEEVESVVEEEIIEDDDEDMGEQADQNITEDDSPMQDDAPKISSAPIPPKSPAQNSNNANDNDGGNGIGWKKPAWTKSPVLRSSDKGKVLKEGGTVSAPITNIAEVAATNDIGWKKPDWTTGTKLKKTGKSAADNLAKPITDLPHMKDASGPGFSKPEWTADVKDDKGIHGNIEKPITSAPHGTADPSLAFQKPGWTKDSALHSTGKGDQLKEGKDIARPIGGIKPVDD